MAATERPILHGKGAFPVSLRETNAAIDALEYKYNTQIAVYYKIEGHKDKESSCKTGTDETAPVVFTCSNKKFDLDDAVDEYHKKKSETVEYFKTKVFKYKPNVAVIRNVKKLMVSSSNFMNILFPESTV